MAELRQRKPTDGSRDTQAGSTVHGRSSKPRRRPRSSAQVDDAVLLLLAPLVLLIHVVLVTVSVQRIYATPPIQNEVAPADVFSEARAVQTVSHLAGTIGLRLVSTQGVEDAHAYVLHQAQQIAAQASRRKDLTAQVQEQRVSGGVNLHYFHAPMGSLYQGLGNVMLRLDPKGHRSEGNTTLLLNAHYDSAIGSPGAADCAACVAVLLELARVLVSDPSIQLPGPILFLFNGGEETLMQAAHGFVHSGHEWVKDIGAFVNLEATGSGGPDTLFQHTADWTVKTYAAAAKYPRGSVFLMDVFEAGFIPSDTDYRMFSKANGQLGRWPGLDIAHILDSASYHTMQDTVGRVRPGILQSMGENTLAVMLAMTQQLTNGSSLRFSPSRAKSVFFDVGGLFMVTYPMSLASILHSVPAMLMLLILIAKAKGTANLLDRLQPVITQANLSVVSFLCAVAIPAALGALRSALSGNPMPYYSSPPLQYSIYLPLALASAALPYFVFSHLPSPGQDPKLPSQRLHRTALLKNVLLGNALVMSAVAGVCVAVGMGSGYLFAAWALCGILAAGFVHLVYQPVVALFGSLILALPAQALSLPLSLLLLFHCVGKANLAGAAPVAQTLVLDAVSGALIGAFTWWNLGFVTPVLVYTYKRHIPGLLGALSLFAFITSLVASCAPTAYSELIPKRVVLQHLNQHDAEGNILSTRWTVAAVDSVPIDRALTDVSLTPISPIQNPWQTFYPLETILQTMQFEAPPAVKPQAGPLTTVRVVKDSIKGSLRHLEVDMQLPAAGWGVLNITSAGLKAWSFTEQVNFTAQPISSQSNNLQHMLRYSCNQGYENWHFWLDMDAAQPEVWLEVAASIMHETDAIRGFVAQLPTWTSAAAVTTFQSSWKL